MLVVFDPEVNVRMADLEDAAPEQTDDLAPATVPHV